MFFNSQLIPYDRRTDQTQRPRYSPGRDRKSKTPIPEAPKEEDRAVRSGSEEGEIEED
jgi:pre-mRNA-processing factor 40